MVLVEGIDSRKSDDLRRGFVGVAERLSHPESSYMRPHSSGQLREAVWCDRVIEPRLGMIAWIDFSAGKSLELRRLHSASFIVRESLSGYSTTVEADPSDPLLYGEYDAAILEEFDDFLKDKPVVLPYWAKNQPPGVRNQSVREMITFSAGLEIRAS